MNTNSNFSRLEAGKTASVFIQRISSPGDEFQNAGVGSRLGPSAPAPISNPRQDLIRLLKTIFWSGMPWFELWLINGRGR